MKHHLCGNQLVNMRNLTQTGLKEIPTLTQKATIAGSWVSLQQIERGPIACALRAKGTFVKSVANPAAINKRQCLHLIFDVFFLYNLIDEFSHCLINVIHPFDLNIS
jgi:hypothetical protein